MKGMGGPSQLVSTFQAGAVRRCQLLSVVKTIALRPATGDLKAVCKLGRIGFLQFSDLAISACSDDF